MLDKDRVKQCLAAIEDAATDVLIDFPDIACYADFDERGKYPSVTFRIQDIREEALKKRRRLNPAYRRKVTTHGVN